MKKFKLLLCLCACVLGLTACGGQTEEKVLDMEVATQLESTTQSIVTECFAALTPDQAAEFAGLGAEYMEYVFENYFGMQLDGNAMIKGVESWNMAIDEMGQFQNITGMSAAYDEQGKNIVVTLSIQGANRTAQLEAIYKDDLHKTLTSITTNVDYTFGEKMSKAALNTLIGMGTVFIVLIIIICVISLFNYIPAITAFFDKKKSQNAEVTATADPAVAQIIEKEELTDDLELIAVITAAIAASGTSGSADDFVVRSIRRKVNSQWNKA